MPSTRPSALGIHIQRDQETRPGNTAGARQHAQDPFEATAAWLWAIGHVWGRGDCVLCGLPFRPGEAVRWLRPTHRSTSDGYTLTHVGCAARSVGCGDT